MVNQLFSPSPSEVEYAAKVVKAFEEAQVKGLGAISFEGRMIDTMNYRQAKEIANLAEVIATKEEERQ